MSLEEIKLILKLLDDGMNEKAIEILSAERDKLLSLKEQQDRIVAEKAFLKYMSEVEVQDKMQWSNLYLPVNNAFFFSNGVSVYKLYQEFTVPETMKRVKRDDSKDTLLLKEAKLEVISSLFNQCKQLLGNNKLLVEYVQKDIENEITIYESNNISHIFSMEQAEYMNIFLGDNATLFISDTNPIAYAESDKGKGYVLGIRK